MLRPIRHRFVPANCRAHGAQRRRSRMLAMFGLAPLTLLVSPVLAQTTRTNQFVLGTTASSSAGVAATPEIATARLMLPQSDSSLVKQPASEMSADFWMPPSASPPTETAGFAAHAPVGPNQNSFETFQPAGPETAKTSRQHTGHSETQPMLGQPTLAPDALRIAMRPDDRSQATTAWAAGPSPASPAENARPKRLPAAGPSSSQTAQTTPLPQPHQESVGQNPVNQRFMDAIAKRRTEERANAPVTPPAAASGMYLATQTAKSKLDEAWIHFQQAELEYSSAAYASAETSAWKTLHLAAEAIDLHDQHTRSRSAIESGQSITPAPSRTAVQRLQSGSDALNEAQDFVGPYATSAPESIARLARSHRTPVVREGLPRRGRKANAASQPNSQSAPQDNLGWYTEMLVESSEGGTSSIPNATEAIDRYLDLARMELSEVAGKSLLAAQAMDLLAAIRLGRGEESQLPGPSAICLRRAAVQGQSNNPDLVAKLGLHLADVGLVEEASWALQHSLTLRYDPQVLSKLNQLQAMTPSATTVMKGAPVQSQVQTRRTPDVVTMTPEQFASVSRSVIPGQGRQMQTAIGSTPARNVAGTTTVEAQPASYRLMNTPPATAALGQINSNPQPNSTGPSDPPEPPTRNSSRFLPQLKKWW
ncbi:organization of plasma membrane [Rhodopirellula islandica]|uniref:Organization of plasma membrane n=1 Tax=Rhodopirellula islandica TaxID=595434 RepID=A0A0J1B3N3_RHOIS|nr:hypothetical protein [Rhodopirellula islandica]KLU01233.1 organization of plasma membrane [Rhodopirellula islandica]